jgi:hypothetical protein
VQEGGYQPEFRLTFARVATRLLREMSRKHRLGPLERASPIRTTRRSSTSAKSNVPMIASGIS